MRALPQVQRAIVTLALVLPFLTAPHASASTITGMVTGFAHDLSIVPGGPPSTSVFIAVGCIAKSDGALPAFITVSCNVVGGGAPGAGGRPSAFPTVQNWPDSYVGASYWYGSSPRPAYGCIEAVATYNDGSTLTFSSCDKIAP
jgi:hypothetical protein